MPWKPAAAKTAMKERRSYPGGNPLTRVLDPAARKVFAKHFSAALRRVPAATGEARLRLVAHALAEVRPKGSRAGQLRRNRPRGAGVPSTSSIFKIAKGEVGPSPARCFELGEALHDAGVTWISGLATLSWCEPYAAHLLATIGYCIALGSTRELRAMWPGFHVMLQMPGMTAEQYAETLTWTDQQHALLRRAFYRWIDSREDDHLMLPAIRAFIAISRLPSSIDREVLWSVRSIARAAIEIEMQNLHPSWGGHPDEPTLQDEIEADRLFRGR